MPRMDRQVSRVAQFLETLELVVDQCTKGTHIDEVESASTRLVRMFEDVRDKREECRLGLAAGRGRSNDDVSIIVKDDGNRTLLYVAQASPTPSPDPAADGLGEPIKRRGLPRA